MLFRSCRLYCRNQYRCHRAIAIGLTKKYLNDTSLTLDEVLNIEETTQPLLMGTDDCKEGIAAFYEKRAAVFTGK